MSCVIVDKIVQGGVMICVPNTRGLGFVRAGTVGFVALAIAWSAWASSQPEGALRDWTTLQGNAAHTGFVPLKLDHHNFAKRWQVPIGQIPPGNLPAIPAIAISNGLVYVSGEFFSGPPQLSVYNETDGKFVWGHDFSALTYTSVNPPALAGGVVYVVAGRQSSTYLFAFDAVSGAPVFQSPMTSQWEHYLAPTVGPHGIYTNGGSDLYAFMRSGKQRFVANPIQQEFWTPAVDDAGVYSYTGRLDVVDPRTGVVKNIIEDETFHDYSLTVGGSPVLGSAGRVFAAYYYNAQLPSGIGNDLLAFSVPTNSIAWRVHGSYPTTPAYSDSTVYAANDKPFRLEARDETDGALKWEWAPPTEDVKFMSEVLLTKNLAFVSTGRATYAISLKSHKTVWSYPSRGKLALSKAGVLYIQTEDTLIAIDVM
jgi:hypothetical protein